MILEEKSMGTKSPETCRCSIRHCIEDVAFAIVVRLDKLAAHSS